VKNKNNKTNNPTVKDMQNKSIVMAMAALGLLCGGAFRSEATLADYQAAVLAEPSLVAYYKFDAGDGADSKGASPLTPSFAGNGWLPATYANGLGGGPDQALTQDGSGNGVPYSFGSPAEFTSGQGTVELWLKPGWTGSLSGAIPLPIIFTDAYSLLRYSVGMAQDKSQIIVTDGNVQAIFFNLPTAADNSWHHLAVEFSAGQCIVIWDGQSLGTQAFALAVVSGTPDQVFTLGAFWFTVPLAAYLPWIGEQDEVAVYTNALPLASIQAHYAASLPPPSSILPVILTQPLAANNWYVGQRRSLSIEVDPLQLPHYQWYKDSGLLSSDTNSALSVSSVVLGNAGTYTCVVTNSGGSVTSSPAVVVVWPTPLTNAMSAYQTAVFAETSLVSYYSFDATSAIDDFGGNNGVLWYDTSFGAGVGGGSDLALNLGGNGMDRLGAVRAFDYVSGNGTVEMWIRADWDTIDFTNYPTILANWGNHNNANWAFCMDPTKSSVVCYDAWAFWSDINLPTNAGTNWHHLAAVFNANNTWTLFWDGVNAGTNMLPGRAPYHGGQTILGSPLSGGGFANVPPWNGAFDEVAFYSAALGASQIQNHARIVLGGPVSSPVIKVAKSGNNLVLSWTEAGNWVLESSPTLPAASWTPVQTNGSPATILISSRNEFFRLRTQ